MTRTLRWIGAPLVALAMLLAACGGDDDDTTADGEGTEQDAGADSSDGGTDDDAAADDGSDASDDAGDDAADDADEDDSDDAAESEDDAGDEQSLAPEILGLEITSIDFDTAEVTITNTGDAAVTLDGLTMCNFPSYAAISGVGDLEPGASITIPSTVALSAAGGELGLYTTESFTDPTAIQAYVEWGSDGHERAPVAIEAGIWDGTALTVEGNTLTNS